MCDGPGMVLPFRTDMTSISELKTLLKNDFGFGVNKSCVAMHRAMMISGDLSIRSSQPLNGLIGMANTETTTASRNMAETDFLILRALFLTQSVVENYFAIKLNNDKLRWKTLIGGVKCKIPLSFWRESGGHICAKTVKLIGHWPKRDQGGIISGR